MRLRPGVSAPISREFEGSPGMGRDGKNLGFSKKFLRFIKVFHRFLRFLGF